MLTSHVMAPHAKKFAFTTSQGMVEDESKAICAEYCDFIQHFVYEDEEPVLWIFGYGSLIWLPKIEYAKSEKGFVKDYALRFWQGNTTHRGTPEAVSIKCCYNKLLNCYANTLLLIFSLDVSLR